MKNEFDYLNDVKMDFSCYEETEKEIKSMKQRTKKNKKVFATAACITVIAATTIFASALGTNVIKELTTGYNKFVQINPDLPHPIPNELKGKIFDKNGNEIESIDKEDIGNLYNKEGKKITDREFADMIAEMTGGLVSVSEEYDAENSEISFDTIDTAQENAVFDIKVPDYLPYGYTISRIYTYKNDDGSASSEYMNIVYKNSEGKDITIFERILNENTAFEAGTDGTLKEISVNGRKAVIMDGRHLDFETVDNVSVSISSHGNISENELIKIAESIK